MQALGLFDYEKGEEVGAKVPGGKKVECRAERVRDGENCVKSTLE